ncbi:EFR1 family ferrodoxin [Clostridium sp. CF012]|uniref:EFR1 family ferrodoxin n=1 Tax=Clostridium sp. CF012 TaxID=2843319 RepID=UPI001C0CC773|nr:EFR1 family ferrodoxin [Clostridium sp. CF012]MBU3145201.1 EFR1 family ferrodoxin [Clostridium sp. CF012]
MKTTIYYFSGTGNSLKVTKDISAKLKDTEIIQICRNSVVNNHVAGNKIGIVFPVYNSGMPLLVKEFVEKIEIPKDAYVFIIVTFGLAAGASIFQLEKLLNHKGIKLSAAFKVKMPGNYQVMYPPYSEEKQKKDFKNEGGKITEIVRSINNNEIVKFTGVGESIMKAVGGVLYTSFKPYEKDKNFWTDEKCNGCGICSKVCPANNIKMNEGKPQWLHKCEQCVACMQWCPQKSIQYKKVTINRGRYHHPDILVTEIFHK